MTPRTSLRARARGIYRELAAKDAEAEASTEAAPTPDPSPLLASARGGGEKGNAPELTGSNLGAPDASPSPASARGVADDNDLTARIRALYETSAVPVREIAVIAGVSERSIYKYARKGNWQQRYARAQRRDEGARKDAAPFEPLRGAGGRFIAREDRGKSFAKGLKALDAPGRARALARTRRALRLSEAARSQAKAERERRRRCEALIKAAESCHRACAALRNFRIARVAAHNKRAAKKFRQAKKRARQSLDLHRGVPAQPVPWQPSPLDLRIERLLFHGTEVALAQWNALLAQNEAAEMQIPVAPAARIL
jgi:hypothetical protein